MKKFKCKSCGKEYDAKVEACECGHKEFDEIEVKVQPKPDPDTRTPEQKMLAELKEILPALVASKQLLDNIPKNEAKIKEAMDQLTNMQGNLTDLANKVIKLGKKEFKPVPTGLTREQKYDFGKYLIAAYKNTNHNENSKQIIKEFHEKYQTTYIDDDKEDKEIKAAMNEGTDAQGGYGVPDLFLDQIWRIAEQASVALRDATQIPLTTGYKLPVISKDGGVTVSWVNEAGAAQESEPTLAKTTTEAKKMLVYSKLSNELLEDEEVGIVDFIINLWAEAMGAEIDAQAFDGSGSPFTGVLRASGVNTVTAAASILNLDWDDCADAISLIKPSVLANAKFYLHRTILNVLRKTKDTTNQYIWQPPQGNRPATIWDFPYELVEQMPSTSDNALNKGFLFFGNMKNYLIGTKGTMTVKMTDIPAILNDQTLILFRRRIAEVIALPAAFSVIKTAASS